MVGSKTLGTAEPAQIITTQGEALTTDKHDTTEAILKQLKRINRLLTLFTDIDIKNEDVE